MKGDLTPCLYLKIRAAMTANPEANASWLALTLNIKRELVDQAIAMAGK